MNLTDRNLSILIDEMIQLDLAGRLYDLANSLCGFELQPHQLHAADKVNYDKIVTYLEHRAERLFLSRSLKN